MDFIDIKIIDILDIALVALLLSQVYRMIRGTAALSIFFGVAILYGIYTVVRLMNMELLSTILGQVMGVGAIALVIVFQGEIRRYLLLLGSRIAYSRNKFIRRLLNNSQSISIDEQMIAELSSALRNMSSTLTGALIVIERASDLRSYAQSGDIIDGQLSSRLIEALFFKNSPMHDGAAIIKHNRVEAARCILPTSDNPEIPAHLGLRHRAAIGLSEATDALVIVVSEERGSISIVQGGEIISLEKNADIAMILTAKLNQQNPAT